MYTSERISQINLSQLSQHIKRGKFSGHRVCKSTELLKRAWLLLRGMTRFMVVQGHVLQTALNALSRRTERSARLNTFFVIHTVNSADATKHATLQKSPPKATLRCTAWSICKPNTQRVDIYHSQRRKQAYLHSFTISIAILFLRVTRTVFLF